LKAVIKVNLYLALGDSITAGYGVGSWLSFPTLYGNFLRRHNPDLRMSNLGVNGLTTRGLLALLHSNHGLRQSVFRASLITLTIGSNDLLGLIRNTNQPLNAPYLPLILNNMSQNFAQVGEEIRRLNPNATVKVATLYNPLPAGPYAQYFAQAQGVLDKANVNIATWAKRYGFNVVYLDREIRGKERLLIGQDNLHPNSAGYQVIAKAFAR
jgi:lysophospholipase L1-like esterase